MVTHAQFFASLVRSCQETGPLDVGQNILGGVQVPWSDARFYFFVIFPFLRNYLGMDAKWRDSDRDGRT